MILKINFRDLLEQNELMINKNSKEIILKSKNWNEFNNNLLDFSESEQGEIFEDLCLYYFKN